MVDKLAELRDSFEMLEDVLNYAYEGYVLVDPQGKIVKMNYEKLLGIKEEDAIGKPVEEIIENTRMHIVVKTGAKELRDVQRIQGHDMITNRIPIIKQGKVIGAVGTVLFKDVSEVKELAHQLLDLQSKINKYRGEIERIEGSKYSFDSIITRNSKMNYLKKVGSMAAETNSTVLITGESGTGKELFAHAIHRASYRKGEAFIAINCAAIPKELLESELFGYDSGAFTGARKQGKVGKFELARGGTIFLDEIGDMPLEMQAKILRVLESKEFERVGSNKKMSFDARVIAATNENIEEAIKKGKFREDLYYRLNVITIEIPPLRERMEDIELLSEEILSYLLKEMKLGEKFLAKETIKILKSYSWPGNVRELRNILERAINLSPGKIILPEHLPERLIDKISYSTEDLKDIPLLKDVVIESEIEAINKALIFTKGNKSLAAEKLGIHRTALYKKIDKYNIGK
ncbi:sigma-54 interaction domain-containing protein [Tissierella praeacuta]|uniref:PAS domain S-box-containing protein n=2 Tax=Tissierella praeacuta TaxID=43131 RepID=A0A1M4WH31_9FIRM|nr:sigma 54-interacting transcriptional regulator [Tissierella praeacuta]TCU79064.1 PAS domain S-box-containing protein [Tissierella praeacuta]SHE80601.1 PAS domain S-box-containing protein [Tissierella praeacuta DSM 18095]SUO99431.1 (S)-limonene 6-monooxygenase [Tissierella praeacuta]